MTVYIYIYIYRDAELDKTTCGIRTRGRIGRVSKEDRCDEQNGNQCCEKSDPPGTDPARIVLL